MKKVNIGIHFSVKLTNNFDQAFTVLTEIFKEHELKKNEVIIHHCFLDEETLIKKIGKSPVYDLFRHFTKNLVCYNQTGDLTADRKAMFKRLADINATSFFIFPLVDGTEIEYNMATEYGVRIQPFEFEQN